MWSSSICPGADSALPAATLVAEIVGARDSAEQDTIASVISAIGDEDLLLVLDNLEQITDIAGFVDRLLASTERLNILATSRIPVGLPLESQIGIHPLALPTDDSVASVQKSPAGRLFLSRARAIGRLDNLTHEEARDVALLCTRLDGLPLALELAAARSRLMSPSAMLRRIEAHQPVLSGRAPGADDRHRSLEAVLDWSYSLLSEDQRSLLIAVAVCAGSFDLGMAEILCPNLDSLTTLDMLVSHGLVLVGTEVAGEPRFRLLETVREYALRHTSTALLSRNARVHAEHVRVVVLELSVAAQPIRRRGDRTLQERVREHSRSARLGGGQRAVRRARDCDRCVRVLG